jgi:hypothetical protein
MASNLRSWLLTSIRRTCGISVSIWARDANSSFPEDDVLSLPLLAIVQLSAVAVITPVLHIVIYHRP